MRKPFIAGNWKMNRTHREAGKLAAGIVERRGGMLIHGAIIAREYGLPCVTGVADATSRIRTGQRITVDGYLGIVTLGDPPPKG